MRVLHILTDGPETSPRRLIAAQVVAHEVQVVDLSTTALSPEELVELIFQSDSVFSW